MLSPVMTRADERIGVSRKRNGDGLNTGTMRMHHKLLRACRIPRRLPWTADLARSLPVRRGMNTRTAITRLSVLFGFVFVGAGCRDAFDLDHNSPTAPHSMSPSFATASAVSTRITLDQFEAAQNIGIPSGSGTHVGKAFDQNPHLGDAIVATFFWRGSTNTITSVSDHLEDETPVGNTYTLVEYVTANGWSMATYVATNVKNFPDPAPSQDKILAVHAIFSDQITEGGELISAYSGVALAAALAAHHSATGTGSTTTIADPGAIPLDAGALAYGVTMANAVVDLADAPGFSPITATWDAVVKFEGQYKVADAVGSVEPQWTWSFQSPSTWFASVVALNPQTTHLAFLVQPSSTLLPGMTIAPPVQVAVVDDQGNTVQSFTGPVTIALAHDGSLLHNARLSGTTVVMASNGVATFSDLSIDQIGSGYTLRATADNVPGVTSNAFNVTIPIP